MDKVEKYGMIQKVLHELEDLQDNETSILKKIAKIEDETADLNIGLLDKSLPDIQHKINDTLQAVSNILSKFREHISQFEKDNKMDLWLKHYSTEKKGDANGRVSYG